MQRSDDRGLLGRPRSSVDAPAAEDATVSNGTSSAARILTVCTGNICRSPLGEMMLRRSLRELDVDIRSAGTHALVGEPMSSPARRIATRLGVDGVDSDGHRAQQLTGRLLESADLILAMTSDHRTYTLRQLPSALRRTFTVREFARRARSHADEEVRAAADDAGAAPGARLRTVANLLASRHDVPPAHPSEDDVIDPYRRPDDVYELSASQLAPALDLVEHVVRVTLS